MRLQKPKKGHLEFPMATPSHGDLMLPHVKVQGVKVILKDQFTTFMGFAHTPPNGGCDGWILCSNFIAQESKHHRQDAE